MDQDRIDELQEELRKKTEDLQRQISEAEDSFAKAIEEEKNKNK